MLLDHRRTHPTDQIEELSCNVEQKHNKMEIMCQRVRGRMPRLGDHASEHLFQKKGKEQIE